MARVLLKAVHLDLILLQRFKVIPSPAGLANIQPVHVEDVCAALAVLAETGWEGSSPPFLAGAEKKIPKMFVENSNRYRNLVDKDVLAVFAIIKSQDK